MLENNLVLSIIEFCNFFKQNRKSLIKPQKDEAKPFSRIFIKNTASKIIKYDKGIIESSYDTKMITKDDYFFTDFTKYFERLENDTIPLKLLTDILKNKYKLDQTKISDAMHKLFIYLLKINSKQLSPKKCLNIAESFKNDIESIKPNWNYKAWIDGIWLNKSVIKINKNITIRKPRNSDLDIELNTICNSNCDSPNSCSAIVEVVLDKKEISEVKEFVYRLWVLLKLYGLGDVTVQREEFLSNSITYWLNKTESNKNGISSSNHKYELTKNISLKISKLFNNNQHFITSNNIGKPIFDSAYLNIAFEQYNNSLNTSSASASEKTKKITYAISCLEALFLSGESELSHRLSQRAAFLMSKLNKSPLQIYKDLKDAYKVRSSYIHGDKIKGSDLKLKEIADNTLYYARLCLLSFIFLSKSNKKDEILVNIDDALLDNKADKKFISLMNDFKSDLI